MDIQIIQNKIYEIRGQRVMLDRDLANLYGVETKALNQAVKRNIERFSGDDFMFQLTVDELKSLRSQIVTLNETSEKQGKGKHFKYTPSAFTEQGVAMLSSVLHSKTAIEINRGIIRAFVQMRNYLASTQTSSAEITELRSRLQLVEHDIRENLEAVNDLSEDMRRDIDAIYEAIGALSVKLPKAEAPRRKIGFYKGLLTEYTNNTK